MSAIHTVVVAVDFSPSAPEAVDAARELIRLPRGHIHLLHVLTDALYAPWAAEAGLDLQRMQREWVEEAKARLEAFAAQHRLDPARITVAVATGPAAHEIVRYATDHDADAIVVGSHGHGIVRRFLLGSVADRVIRQATCPVLIVPRASLQRDEATAAVAAASR